MDHLSTLTLHRLRYGELDLDEERAAQAHLDDCERCASLLQRQQAARQEFELKPVPAAIIEAARPRPAWRRAVGSWQPALALAAAALLVVLGLPRFFEAGPEADEIRYRGLAEVEVLVEGSGLLEPGQTLVAGDRVQLRIGPGPWRHAWVGDGETVLEDFALDAGRATLAPFSLTLDDSQEDEEIVVVLAERSLDRGTLKRAMAGGRIDGVTVVRRTLPRGQDEEE